MKVEVVLPVPQNEEITSAEKVLVFPTELLEELGIFEGLFLGPNLDNYTRILLESGKLEYMERSAAEKNPKFKQLIPYTILLRNQHVFCYQRTKNGGEPRLHDLWSIGVGGHINPGDGEGKEAYEQAFRREIAEEVLITGNINKAPIVALVNDNSNEVGKVHFGVVHTIQVGSSSFRFLDQTIQKGFFQEPAVLKNNIDIFESWSKLLIDGYLRQ